MNKLMNYERIVIDEIYEPNKALRGEYARIVKKDLYAKYIAAYPNYPLGKIYFGREVAFLLGDSLNRRASTNVLSVNIEKLRDILNAKFELNL